MSAIILLVVGIVLLLAAYRKLFVVRAAVHFAGGAYMLWFAAICLPHLPNLAAPLALAGVASIVISIGVLTRHT